MSKFQKFISYNIMYAESDISKESVITFATMDNGKFAKEPTDLTSTQLEVGGFYLDDYSSFLINQEDYINKLQKSYVQAN